MSCSTTSHAPQSGTEDRHRQRDAAVVAREPALAQRLDALARMRNVREGLGALGGRRLGGAVGEHRADAAVDQAVDRALGQLDVGDVVAPVDQRGDAGVDLRQRADQVAEVVVLGLVAGREVEMHVAKIVAGHPLGADAAQRGFPGVHVRVDEARHHDLVGGVDHLVGRGAEVAAHRFDPVAGEQKLAVLEVADLRIERDQPAAANQHALHERWSPFPAPASGAPVSLSLCKEDCMQGRHWGVHDAGQQTCREVRRCQKRTKAAYGGCWKHCASSTADVSAGRRCYSRDQPPCARDIAAITSSTLKLEGFCRGGKSLNVSMNWATNACAGTIRNAR